MRLLKNYQGAPQPPTLSLINSNLKLVKRQKKEPAKMVGSLYWVNGSRLKISYLRPRDTQAE